MAILSVSGLCKHYDSFTLDHASFSLDDGYIMGFIGRNGAGKSTTLRSMLGLAHPSAGSVEMFGKDFYANELECKQHLGVVFGEFDYYKQSKISSIIKVTKRLYTNWSDEACAKYMTLFELDPSKRVKELSSGMKVKLSLMLAMSHNASLLILDEPTSGLDPVSRDELVSVFRSIVNDGKHSVLFSTHITSDLDKCADYITYIKNGQIIASTDTVSFTDEYILVNGARDELTPQVTSSLIGYELNAFGFTGLAYAKAERQPMFKYARADIESIMLHIEKADEGRTSK